MCRITSEDGISLGARDLSGTGGLGYAAVVVSQIRIQWAEGGVRLKCHRGEELNAIGLALGAEPHYPIEEAIGAFARRHARDIRRAYSVWRLSGDGTRGGRVSSTAESLAGDESDEGEQGDRCDRPRECRCWSLPDNSGLNDGACLC